MFAEEDPTVKFSSVGLLKLTSGELEELLRPGKYLKGTFKQNNYIYLIDKDGDDAVFSGIAGDIDQWKNAPYIICPVHTPTAWEEYQLQKQEPTIPDDGTTDSTDTPVVDPTDPAQ